ncbi:uncharacterized protein LOC111638405 [Centruroides sculpturatus]|uniref:uncharacterized protein LOC111638405 n=1 Tax=Centruroides sculpturatus TaxID=218467 RepID=UPI000C6DF9E0|nr:uncharacterized protein LOC111638405 [Centruroides sculpturatus]
MLVVLTIVKASSANCRRLYSMQFFLMRNICFNMNTINIECFCIETIFQYEDGFYVKYDYQYVLPQGYGLYVQHFPHQQAPTMLAYRLPSEDGVYGSPSGVVDSGLQAFQYQPQAEMNGSEPLEEFPPCEMQTHQSDSSSVAEMSLHPGQPNMLQNNSEPVHKTRKEVENTEPDVLSSFETCQVVSNPHVNGKFR